MLASLTEAFPRALAQAVGIDATRLRWVMHGREPYYRTSLALVPLGLVEQRLTRNGVVYAVTERGRRKARQLTARSARRAAARALARSVPGSGDPFSTSRTGFGSKESPPLRS